MKTLLIFLLLPIASTAQFVDPVISKDYLDRSRDSSRGKIFFTDTTNSAKKAFLLVNNSYNAYKVKKIIVRNGYLNIQPAGSKTLYLAGSYTSSVELKTINGLPSVQNQYVQGRGVNGKVSWQGPETNDLFSYGPLANTLEFDGSNYAYDVNGRLVMAGSGNGKKAIVYDNDIFRNGVLFSQSLALHARYVTRGRQFTLKLKGGHSDENTVIRQNKNNSGNFSTAFEGSLSNFKVTAAYNHITENLSNPNRNGFLNRVFQSSLLTPISFANAQGAATVNGQRSYSNAADNPLYLLEDNGNSFHQSHNTASLKLEEAVLSRLKLRIDQSIEKLNENGMEGYKPGTANFPAGITTNRKKTDVNYILNPGVSYEIWFSDYNFRSNVSANYILGDSRSGINYGATNYNYQRLSHDVAFVYQGSYQGHWYNAGIKAENKFYASSTSPKKDFFLPGLSGYFQFENIDGNRALTLKLVSSFIDFNSELPVTTSFSQFSLLHFSAEQAGSYFPTTEIGSFDNLFPIQHQEWMGRAVLSYKNKLTFEAEYFNRKSTDDVFPVFENGSFDLKNIATHRNSGIELNVTYIQSSRKVTTTNSLSFFSYKDIVTGIRTGFDFTPIAGFSNVNTALVNGKALGVIVGNLFLRDNANNIIVGSDGFPMVDPTPGVIGDPTPDFILKLNHHLSWKKFSLTVDWQWRKGGDVWNGTQAVLDYYGRSQVSTGRITTGFIFPGVTQDGHVNNVPVRFYDPALPLDQSRWVRHGYSGVAEEYIRRGDNIGLSYSLTPRKYLQSISFTLYANNIIIWTPYKGVDPGQLMYDQADTNGLDYFNLPSLKSFGASLFLQF